LKKYLQEVKHKIKNKQLKEVICSVAVKYRPIEKILLDKRKMLKTKQYQIEEYSFLERSLSKIQVINSEPTIKTYTKDWDIRYCLAFDKVEKSNLTNSAIFKENPNLKLLNLFLRINIITIQAVAESLSKYNYNFDPDSKKNGLTKNALAGKLAKRIRGAFSALSEGHFISILGSNTSDTFQNPIIKEIVLNLGVTCEKDEYMYGDLKKIIAYINQKVLDIPDDILSTYTSLALDITQEHDLLGFKNIDVKVKKETVTKTYIIPSLDTQRLVSKYAISYKNLPLIVKPPTVQTSADLCTHEQYLSTRAKKSTTFVNKPHTFSEIKTTFNNESVVAFNALQQTCFLTDTNVSDGYIQNMEKLLRHEAIDIYNHLNFEVYMEHNGVAINKPAIVGAYQNDYRKQVAVFSQLIEALAVAHIYRKHDLYFPVSWCFRGRFYYRGWPINPQVGEVIRGLIKMKEATLPCRYDATSSAYQIMSCLLYDPDSLKIFRLIEGTPKAKELYAYIDNILFPINGEMGIETEGLHSTDDPDLSRPEVEKNNFKNIRIKKTIIFYKELHKLNYKERRPFIKKLSMCLAFNQGPKGLSTTCLEESVTYKNILFRLFEKNSSAERKSISIKLCAYLCDSLDYPFKFIKDFNYCIRMIVKLSKKNSMGEICFIKGALFESVHSYKVPGITRYRYTFDTLRKVYSAKNKSLLAKETHRRSFSGMHPLPHFELDGDKFNIASMPNIVHQIDAIILHIIVYEFAKADKPISTLHDCYCINENDVGFLFKAYNKILEELFFNKDFEKTLIFSILYENLLKKELLDKLSKKERKAVQNIVSSLRSKHAQTVASFKPSSTIMKLEKAFIL